MTTPYERLCRWRDVGDGPVGYCACDKEFGDDVKALLAALAPPEPTEGPRYYFMGPFENSTDPSIARDDPAGGDPVLIATFRRIYHPDELHAALRAMPLQDGAATDLVLRTASEIEAERKELKALRTEDRFMAGARAICQHDNDEPLCDELTMRGCCLPKARAAILAEDQTAGAK